MNARGGRGGGGGGGGGGRGGDARGAAAAAGGRGRANVINWTQFQTDRLLSLVEQLMPMGEDHWAEVTNAFNQGLDLFMQRDIEAIRGRFKRLRTHRKAYSRMKA